MTAWFETLIRNVRYACRGVARTPGFTITVIGTLALGMGANTAMFSAIDAVVLQPLPFPDADRLVKLTQVSDTGERNTAAVRLEDWDHRATTFVAITNHVGEDVSDTTGVDPERVRRVTVGPRFLDVVGIRPALGRGFTDAEHRLGGPNVALISDRYWRDRFNSDPRVLDQSVRMSDRSYAIVGVLPPSFGFPEEDIDWWVPQWSDAPWAQARGFGYEGVGRLKPGVSLEQATADLERVQRQLAVEYPKTDAQLRPRVVPLKEAVVGGVSRSLWLLLGAVSILLLIACTNIAALLLARGAQRRNEVAIRYAIGGSRWSVASQLLTESVVLAIAGAAAGVVVAIGVTAGLRALAPTLPRIDEMALNGRVLIYTAAATAVVALLCGVMPALRGTRVALRADGGRMQGSPRQRLQWLLVGVQVALSVTLLAGAGLLVRSLDALSRVDPGFDSAPVLTFRVSGSFGEERDYNRTVQRINRSLDELAGLPEVETAATTTMLPGVPNDFVVEFEVVELRDGGNSATNLAGLRMVSPSYFEALQIPVLEGELCRRPEDSEGVSEVMVNRAFVAQYLQGRSAVGRHVTGPTTGSPDRIVGVVGDARETGVDRQPAPMIYGCFSAPTPIPWFLVKTRGKPQDAVAAVRARLRQLEPQRSVYDTVPLQARIDEAYAQNRLRTIVLTLFAIVALLLTCLGVYGTLNYVVSLRRREAGLRVALGASRLGIVRQFVGYALRVVCVATAAGFILSLAFARALSGMLFGTSPLDPATLSGVIALVPAVGSVAAIIPAARAAMAEPAQVLRAE